MPTKEQVLEKLKTIPFPGLQRDIVSFGLVKDLQIDGDAVALRMQFTSQAGNAKAALEPQLRSALENMGFRKIALDIQENVHTAQPRQAPPHGAGPAQQGAPAAESFIPEVKATIAVASGKGGVGKSTVAVNLACALNKLGKKVGILDADIYGPNIPMMLGLEGKRPAVQGNLVMPLQMDGIEVMSLGFLAPSDTAIIWRGPLVGRAIEQMLQEVSWGALDYLIIDLPPGTGDAQLTLTQRLDLTGAVMVSTPQPVALSDALKGLRMFQKVNVPIIGIIENMSAFVCDKCGKEHDLFGKGGVEKAAKQEKVRFLGVVPLTPEIRVGGDRGKPVVLHHAGTPAAEAFMKIARTLVEEVPARVAEVPKHFKL